MKTFIMAVASVRAYGTEVAVTIDIEARCTDGFNAKTVRIVRENSATLKFRTAEFEEE
jgi:hypothetical protein